MMKYSVVAFFCCVIFLSGTFDAHATLVPENRLFRKIFPLLYNMGLRLNNVKQKPSSFIVTGNRLLADAQAQLKHCDKAACFNSPLQFTEAEIAAIGDDLVKLLSTDPELQKLLKTFRSENKYTLWNGEADTSYIRKAWQVEARSINNILDVYIAGRKPLYPKIDSISFKKEDPVYRDSIAAVITRLVNQKGIAKIPFFEIPVQLALETLRLNGRREAVQYEPMMERARGLMMGMGRKINWDSFRYSVILVPGLGPEDPTVKLDPAGARRCDSAAARYRAGLAPFIVVSGGHVHPYKTPYCEAMEMRNYLIDSLHIPFLDVIIEPDARHTTTNLRNTNRILYKTSFPVNKPVLIVTDVPQTNYINGAMKDRVVKELGYTPFKTIKKISATETEYLPSESSLHTNSLDPLDP